MSSKNLNFILIVLIVFSLFSCSDDDSSPLNVPDAYDGSGFAANATDELALNANLNALVNEMKDHVTNLTIADLSSLNAHRAAGNLKLNDITLSSYNSKITQFLNEFVAASGNSWTPDQIGTPGGKFGDWIFQGEGAEPLQLIEKGSFGAAQYRYAVNNFLTPNATLADLDKAIALYGAHPDFPNSNNGAKHTNSDKFLAGYAARRDDNSGNGIYLTIKKNFIKAQAAIKAGSDFDNEKIEALQAIISNWEKGFAATSIFYAGGVQSVLSLTSPTDLELATALHENSEGASFLLGLKGVSPKLIKDAEIDEIVNLFLIPDNGTISAQQHISNRITAVNNMQEIINKIQNIYGFSNDEVAMFKRNLVADQQR